MIVHKMLGRAGNQFFQYAFIRWMQIKTGEEVYMDDEILKQTDAKRPNQGWEDCLKYFNVAAYKKGNDSKFWCKEEILFKIINKLIKKSGNRKYEIQKKYANFWSKMGIIYMDTGYHSYKLKKRSYYVQGYFESHRFFKEIDDLICEELTPKEDVLDKNLLLYEKICMSESICLTVRKFSLQDPRLEKQEICNEAYYFQGIDYIKQRYPDAIVFIFSDDILWCKENIHLGGEVYYESGDDPIWEKIRLMYSCKHFVISNSTFSWWAQHLSKNKDKIVVAPSVWRREENGMLIDIYEDNWHLIEIV